MGAGGRLAESERGFGEVVVEADVAVPHTHTVVCINLRAVPLPISAQTQHLISEAVIAALLAPRSQHIEWHTLNAHLHTIFITTLYTILYAGTGSPHIVSSDTSTRNVIVIIACVAGSADQIIIFDCAYCAGFAIVWAFGAYATHAIHVLWAFTYALVCICAIAHYIIAIVKQPTPANTPILVLRRGTLFIA